MAMELELKTKNRSIWMHDRPYQLARERYAHGAITMKPITLTFPDVRYDVAQLGHDEL